jgi:glycine/D-amino acid oxidase-like deaminating enzyme
MNQVDAIIVGQGLAGTLLAISLTNRGKSVVIFDANHKHSSSTVAAGIINPLTGRKFSKSWKFETFLPYAKKTYHTLELELKSKILYKRNIIRSLANPGIQNSWLSKQSDPAYQPYFEPEVDLGAIPQYIKGIDDIGEVKEGYQVDINVILNFFNNKWTHDTTLISGQFDHSHLSFDNAKVHYKGLIADRIVFCEGQQARFNPFFADLPLDDSKGEVLLFDSSMPGFNKMFKKRNFIVPLPNRQFWFGPKDQWGAKDDLPTKAGRIYLEKALGELLSVPYIIREHKAAIRPSVKDRRPLLGNHSVYPNVYIFNGLGTKGSLLGPYWADKMTNFIFDHEPLSNEVNIHRFN